MHCLELIYNKNYFNLAKIFALRLFKMAINQSAPGLNRVIKFWVAVKCKTCEIYRCDVFREAYSSQKMFTNGLNMGLPLQIRVKKTIHQVKTHWLSSKEKVLGTVFSQKGHTESLLRQERAHHNSFPWKKCNSKQYFLVPGS